MKLVLAIDPERRTNAQLIADCFALGYLSQDDLILDTTHGLGRWWKLADPKRLVAMDLEPGKGGLQADFLALPFPPGLFDAVAYDPPYKLNGASRTGSDESYGVDVYAKMGERLSLAEAGMPECVRVTRPGGLLLVKCQAQVAWGHIRWMDRRLADIAEALGCVLEDRMDLLGGRPQPAGRRQVHARRNHSTLLICRKGGLRCR